MCRSQPKRVNKDLEYAQNLAYFRKKISTTAGLFALVSQCQALLRAQDCANLPTHMHTHTCMQNSHTVFKCQFYLPQKDFVFFTLLLKRMKLQLLDSSRDEKSHLILIVQSSCRVHIPCELSITTKSDATE